MAIDNGTGTLKIGLAGEDTPRTNMPSLSIPPNQGGGNKEWICGEEAIKLSESTRAKSIRPFNWGIVRDWDAADALWKLALKPYVEQ